MASLPAVVSLPVVVSLPGVVSLPLPPSPRPPSPSPPPAPSPAPPSPSPPPPSPPPPSPSPPSPSPPPPSPSAPSPSPPPPSPSPPSPSPSPPSPSPPPPSSPSPSPPPPSPSPPPSPPSSPPPCVNTNKKCKKKKCKKYSDARKLKCKKTCDVCDGLLPSPPPSPPLPPSPPACEDNDISGLGSYWCKLNTQYATASASERFCKGGYGHKCKKTCGLCDSPSFAPPPPVPTWKAGLSLWQLPSSLARYICEAVIFGYAGETASRLNRRGLVGPDSVFARDHSLNSLNAGNSGHAEHTARADRRIPRPPPKFLDGSARVSHHTARSPRVAPGGAP
eukprot:scaffold3098_cov61-Phaeocystis_antarctica.AAC.1